MIYLELNDLSNAEIAFGSALRINPDSEDSLIGLFRVYYLQDKTDEAIATGEKLLEFKPDSVEFHMALKNLYKKKGDKEKVFLELQRLESLVPDNEQVIKEIIQYFIDQNDIEGLSRYYEKIEEMKIEDVKLGIVILRHYYENSQYDRTIEMAKKLLAKENITEADVNIIYTYLTLSYFDKDDISNTETYITRIKGPYENIDETIRKKLASIFSRIGTRKLADKRRREAIYFFEKAHECDRDNKYYQEALEKIKAESSAAQKLLIRKTLLIIGGIAVIFLVIISLWNLMRNKIIIKVEPATDVAIFIDGERVMLKSKEIGVYESPDFLIGSRTITIEKEGYDKWLSRVNIFLAGIQWCMQNSFRSMVYSR
ncbi:MAG: hypothetical protein N3A65_02500 [candidate division WOR-3 bacterium]|nr:hypothetical protein [candidate division WOR-3 bacterium]